MNSCQEAYKIKLKESGYKLTPQRLAIINAIEENKGKHLNTEEIYDIVKQRNPEMGLATVYRTLQMLDELEVVSSLNLEDGCVRYELYCDDGSHHHHHLICSSCGAVIEVEGDLLDQLEAKIEKEYDFKIVDHKLKFYGLCSKCKNLV
ncbi:Fur family transcriptional regulator [Fusibacter sp. 3D3]|uniref:Fur family transcriptional regulator n=1 Tax=Fusibacter sp. 3D3 TaxID=1048380 RepID=UPI000853A5E8|nr:Fur family transcriptional regulator [Fusibacter sp. 3D3]GAU76951.1 ferric uptake regulation protein FUR [Fusibacter sp. 3D3]